MRALFYHGIMTTPVEYESYYAFNLIPATEFEAQAKELAKHWRVLSLAEIHEHLAEKKPFPDRAVHLSFDDGVKSTLIAADILDRLGLPWTLFVVVDTLLDGYQPSFARVVEAASATGNVVRVGGTEFDLRTNAGKYLFDRRAKAIFANAASKNRDALTSELLASPGVTEPSEAAFPFMTLEEVKELQGRGVEIGNHSARHANLTRCTEAELEHEVSDSRRRLERALGAPVRFFSYPDGRHNRAVRNEVAGSHDVAVATWKALRPYAPLALRRIQAPPTSKELPRVLVPASPRRFWWEREKWDLRRRRTELRSRYQRSS